MPVRYYDLDDNNFPKIMIAVGQSILHYLATKIYPNEDPDEMINQENSTHKFILANFDSSPEVAVHRAIEDIQKTSSAVFPFTAFTWSEETLRTDVKSHLQVSGKVFSDIVQAYVQAIPVEWEIPTVTFNNNVQDYFHARQLLSVDSSRLTRITVPLIINGVLTSFPADIEFEMTKGSYAYKYEEYLSKGNLYDLVVNLKVKFLYLILNDVPVSPVDSITVSLATLATASKASQFIQSDTSPTTPIITSTVPTNGAIGFDKTQNIVINFNVAMNESITNSYIDINPMFPCNLIWNEFSTQLNIQPQSGLLDVSTTYTITIEKNVKSYNQVNMEDDYVLIFTTGV